MFPVRPGRNLETGCLGLELLLEELGVIELVLEDSGSGLIDDIGVYSRSNGPIQSSNCGIESKGDPLEADPAGTN